MTAALLLAAPATIARAQSIASVADTAACAAATTSPSGMRVPRTAPSAGDSTTRRPRSDSGAAAVVVYAAASVGEIRFATQPDLRVRLCGGLDSIHVLERRNLPSPVVAGTTYRNVYVAVEIFGRLNADCITQTLTGKRAAADSSRAGTPRLDCASLEVRGGSTSPTTRPPADSSRPPRR